MAGGEPWKCYHFFYIWMIKHGRDPKKLFKAFSLFSVRVTYLSGLQKPCQIPTQAFHTVWETDGKLLQSHLVGITVIYSPPKSRLFSSLDFATKWTLEEDMTRETEFQVLNLGHTLLLMFLWKREWNQFYLDSIHLYEKVTELLMGDTLPCFQQRTQVYKKPAPAGGLQLK